MRVRTVIAFSTLGVLLAACSSVTETAIEQLVESGEGISNVAIDDGEVTIEFEDSEGGGSLVLGGGDIPTGLPMPVPDGGEVLSSIEQGGNLAIVLQYTQGQYEEIFVLYQDWVAGQATDNLAETRSTNPRSDGWIGEIGDASFGIVLLDGVGESGEAAVSVILNWEG